MALFFCFLIAIVAGLRAITAPAAAALSARLGWIAVASTLLTSTGYRWTVWVFGLLALVELVTDQLSTRPSRAVPLQFGSQLVTGALAWATLAVGTHRVFDALLGLDGAVTTLGGALLTVVAA